MHALQRLLVQEAAFGGAHVVEPGYAWVNIFIAATLRNVYSLLSRAAAGVGVAHVAFVGEEAPILPRVVSGTTGATCNSETVAATSRSWVRTERGRGLLCRRSNTCHILLSSLSSDAN